MSQPRAAGYVVMEEGSRARGTMGVDTSTGKKGVGCFKRASTSAGALFAVGSVVSTIMATVALGFACRSFATETYVRVFTTPCVHDWPSSQPTCPPPRHQGDFKCPANLTQFGSLAFYQPVVNVWTFEHDPMESSRVYVAIGNYSCASTSFSLFVRHSWAQKQVTQEEWTKADVSLTTDSDGDWQGVGGVLAPRSLVDALANTAPGTALANLTSAGHTSSLYDVRLYWSSTTVKVWDVAAGDGFEYAAYMLLAAVGVGLLMKVGHELHAIVVSWGTFRTDVGVVVNGKVVPSSTSGQSKCEKAVIFVASNVFKFSMYSMVVPIALPDYSDPIALKVHTPFSMHVMADVGSGMAALIGGAVAVVLGYLYLTCCTSTRSRSLNKARQSCFDSIAKFLLRLLFVAFVLLTFTFGVTLTFLAGVASFVEWTAAHHILDLISSVWNGHPIQWFTKFMDRGPVKSFIETLK